jgi:hypothetical protein
MYRLSSAQFYVRSVYTSSDILRAWSFFYVSSPFCPFRVALVGPCCVAFCVRYVQNNYVWLLKFPDAIILSYELNTRLLQFFFFFFVAISQTVLYEVPTELLHVMQGFGKCIIIKFLNKYQAVKTRYIGIRIVSKSLEAYKSLVCTSQRTRFDAKRTTMRKWSRLTG